MNLWNNKIVAHSLSKKKGDRMTYFNGLDELIKKKKTYGNLSLGLHIDQGSVYSSNSFNEVLPLHNIIHLLYRAGTPTDNGAMEAINGWIKAELFINFKLKKR
jgi:transposase InsO family protein